MTYNHLEGLLVTAYFSDCGKYRYVLQVVNPEIQGSKTICVVMQNPSEANADKADKSVQFLERLVFKTGCDAFRNVARMIIVNQFAFIQKNGFRGVEDHIGVDNDKVIRNSILESDIVLVAWGKINPYQKRKKLIFKMLAECGDKIFFETKKHPSRGFYKEFIKPLQIPQSV